MGLARKRLIISVLVGIPAVAIDRRLLKFLNIAGINCDSYIDAQEVINVASDLLGHDRAHLDHRIWQYMEADNDDNQNSHLCRP